MTSHDLTEPDIYVKISSFIQDPSINITELKEIHSEINLTVPDPILLPNLHDGLEAVRAHLEGHMKARDDICFVES